jgi:hypothetical protein
MAEPRVQMLVTTDSGPLHLGACTPELPILGIFTAIEARLRTPVRKGELGYRFRSVEKTGQGDCRCTTGSGSFFVPDFKGVPGFSFCPKRRFLERTEKMLGVLTNDELLVGLRERFPEMPWRGQDLKRQIARKQESFGLVLPCFPSPKQVFSQFDRFWQELYPRA